MGIKKILLFVNLGLIVVGVIFLICGLALPWHTLKVEEEVFGVTTSYTYDLTLTKMKAKSEGISMSSSLKDSCDDDSSNPFCKLYKGSIAVIVLTVFGMLSLVVAGVIAVLTLFTQLAEKAVFKFAYLGTSIAAFVLVLISFIVYNVTDDDAMDFDLGVGEKFKFGAGWVLYLIAMIFSFATLILGLSNVVLKDDAPPS